jgi:hypothetical protein
MAAPYGLVEDVHAGAAGAAEDEQVGHADRLPFGTGRA